MGSASKKCGIKQFEGDNFEHWKYRVEVFLDMEGLKEMLTTKPPEDAARLVDHKKDDKKAKAYLVSFISDTHLEYVRGKETAEEMWSSLIKNFAKSGAASQNYLRRKLLNMKYEEGTEMRDHFKRFDECARELKSAGAMLAEGDLVSHMFLTLPPSFDALTTALENLKAEELTLDLLKNRLLLDEEKRKGRNSEFEQSRDVAAFVGQTNKKADAKPKKFNGKCFKCGKYGHTKKECRSKFQTEANMVAPNDQNKDETFEKSVCFMTKSCHDTRNQSWILDSGSSEHLINEDLFASSKLLSTPLIISVAKQNQSMKATKIGVVQVMSTVGAEKIPITIRNAFLVPELRHNLLSVKSLTKAGLEVIFNGSNAIIKSCGHTVAVGNLRNELYELKFDVIQPTANTCCKKMSESELWHRRYGHLNQQYVYKLYKNEMVTGMSEVENHIGFCEYCIKGKQSQLSFSGTRPPTTRPLERVHSDLCGPISPQTYDGKKYFLSFIDDYTHFTVIYLIQSKSDVFKCFREYEEMATAQFGSKISKLRTDLGSEYFSNEQKMYYKSKGIQLESTVGYTPQQNGVAERLNRTIVEKVRTMLLESRISKSLWGEAVRSAVYLLNRSPTSGIKDNKTPAELWFNNKPNVNKIRVFGSQAFALIPKQKRSKLDAKSRECCMIGYDINGYRLWDLEFQKIVIARDVVFNESVFPFESSCAINSNIMDSFPSTKDEIQNHENNLNNLDESLAVSEEYFDSVSEANDVVSRDELRESDNVQGCDDENIQGDEIMQGDTTIALPSQSHRQSTIRENLPRRSDRERRIPGKYLDYDLSDSSLLAANCFSDVPKSYSDLTNHPQQKLWKAAVQEEIESLVKNQTWDVCECPKGIKALTSKWVFKLKPESEGKEVKYKARLVARGFLQQYGRDFDETYAPVAKLSTVRTVLAVANEKSYHIQQMDVKTAFLNGNLNEEVYMQAPDGFNIRPGLVCKLKKSLYGLKQSPRCWNNRFNNFILSLGFVRSQYDYCLYVKVKGADIVYLVVYVDDLLIAGNNTATINCLKEQLSHEFDMTDMGEISCFLGIQIQQNHKNGEILLSQRSAIETLLKEYQMNDCKPLSLPLEPKIHLTKGSNSSNKPNLPYRELIGSLMYIMLGSRPDLCYAVGYLSRYQENPSEEHWATLKKVLRYLQGTKGLIMKYVKAGNNVAPLVGFVDSDWGSDVVDRKSQTGFMFKVYGSIVCWSSKKQHTVALSSCEAEYIAACAAAVEAVWLKGLLNDLRVSVDKVCLYEDNQGCIKMSKNVESKRAKHIDIKYHFLREKVRDGTIEIIYIDTSNQEADIFTKPLPRPVFEKHREKFLVDSSD